MFFKKKFVLISFLLIIELFALNIHRIIAGEFDLQIRGRVVGYEVSSPVFNLNYTGNSKILIVQVSKVLKGEESSQYLIILISQKNKKNILKSNKTIGFKLKRVKSCDDKLGNLLNIQVTNEKGEVTEIIPRLKSSVETELENLPSDKILPCYILS